MNTDKRVIGILIFLSLLFVGCGDDTPVIENTYEQRVMISEDALFEFAKKTIKQSEPQFKYENGEYILYLGEVPKDIVDDRQELLVLAKMFDFNPTADTYIVEYRKLGAYDATYADKRLQYTPSTLTFNRLRINSKINLNETWTCMTFDDFIYSSETGSLPTDCYSFMQPSNPEKKKK